MGIGNGIRGGVAIAMLLHTLATYAGTAQYDFNFSGYGAGIFNYDDVNLDVQGLGMDFGTFGLHGFTSFDATDTANLFGNPPESAVKVDDLRFLLSGGSAYGVILNSDGTFCVRPDADVCGVGVPDLASGTYSIAKRVQPRIFSNGQVRAIDPLDAATGSKYGNKVDFEDFTLVVTSPYDDSAAPNAGSAKVYYRDGDTYDYQGKLLAPDASDGDNFGAAVVIEGDTLVIGAWLAGAPDAQYGAAYVYSRSGSTWSHEATLTASDGADGDLFGFSVDLLGDTILVGAPYDDDGGSNSGAAYVFNRSGGSWTQQAKLTASDASASDWFGTAVSISGSTVAVGAQNADTSSATAAGAAYVFNSSGGTWTESGKLEASDGQASDKFGRAVEVLASYIVLVGTEPSSREGVAYLFVETGGIWDVYQTLVASDGFAGNAFGSSLDWTPDTGVIGASFDGASDGSNNPGGAYLFSSTSSQLVEVKKSSPAGGESPDFAGSDVALWGDTMVMGAPDANDPTYGDNVGAIYVEQFDCGFGDTIPSQTWKLISLPCDIGSNNTIEAVLGDDLNTVDYGTSKRWIVFRWDAATSAYIPLELTDTLQPGVSYWVYSLDATHWDADDNTYAGNRYGYDTGSSFCTSSLGCYEIPLVAPSGAQTGLWNLIGLPANITTAWADVRIVVNDIAAYTPSEAEAANLVSKNIYYWNGASYDVYNDMNPDILGYLYPDRGHWVQTLANASEATSISLLVPYRADAAAAPAITMTPLDSVKPWYDGLRDVLFPRAYAASNKHAQNWQVVLTARSAAPVNGQFMTDTGNLLGQLLGSQDEKDSQDMPALPPNKNSPYLTLEFPHPEWQAADNYVTDLRSPKLREAEEWYFQVSTDDVERDIVLEWSEIHLLEHWQDPTSGREYWDKTDGNTRTLAKRMWLEDVDTGEIFRAYSDSWKAAYEFNMDGRETRTFRWLVADNSGNVKARKQKPSQLQPNEKWEKRRASVGKLAPPGIEKK